MNLLQTILAAPRIGGMGGSFLFPAIATVSTLLIAIGVFYVLIKLGSFIDALKEKTDAKK